MEQVYRFMLDMGMDALVLFYLVSEVCVNFRILHG